MTSNNILILIIYIYNKKHIHIYNPININKILIYEKIICP